MFRGHVVSNITTDVQNGVPLHGHKPGDIVSIRQIASSTTVCCTTDQTALRRCCSFSTNAFRIWILNMPFTRKIQKTFDVSDNYNKPF